tara:strand:+ start:67 stop:285 length:219 start_codon:yes stop_codon:yes gene_type:complete
MEEKNIVTIDDIDYNVDELDEDAKYIISQMTFLKNEIETNRQTLDRNQMSYNGFAALLQSNLKEMNDGENTE